MYVKDEAVTEATEKKKEAGNKKEQERITDADRRWLKLMKLGEKTGCHQRYDRSFIIQNKQFPICARCTGVFTAYIILTVYYVYNDWLKKLFHHRSVTSKMTNNKVKNIAASIGCITMLLDWSVQALNIKESTNKRRFITGITGGFGLMYYYHKILNDMIGKVKSKR